MTIKVHVSNGDLLDRISILEIKLNKITDEAKKKNIEREFSFLVESVKVQGETTLLSWLRSEEYNRLLEVNFSLWEIEDQIRAKEAKQEFDDEFIHLARSVYLVNDERAAIKREINMETKSLLIEEKEYVDYSRAKCDEKSSN